jgi:Predicted membrane protein
MNGSEFDAFATYYNRPEMDSRVLTWDRLKYYYTSTNGRISRLEYFAATAMIYVAFLGAGFALMMFSFASIFSGNIFTVLGTFGMGWLLYFVLWLAGAVACFLAGAKRAHDRNKSGWFVLLYFVPILSLWPFVELYFLPGTAGNNLYGNDPLVRFGTALTPPPNMQPGAPSRGAATAETSATAMRPSPSPQQMFHSPRLLGTGGEYANATIPVDAGGIVMGRDAARCNLVLNSGQVSRVHARVTFRADQGQFIVEDLGSSNGVFIGQQQVSGKSTLASGQSFRLGKDAATFTVLCG